jgi:hypothetical protein
MRKFVPVHITQCAALVMFMHANSTLIGKPIILRLSYKNTDSEYTPNFRLCTYFWKMFKLTKQRAFRSSFFLSESFHFFKKCQILLTKTFWITTLLNVLYIFNFIYLYIFFVILTWIRGYTVIKFCFFKKTWGFCFRLSDEFSFRRRPGW